jgi:hypothetical protein
VVPVPPVPVEPDGFVVPDVPPGPVDGLFGLVVPLVPLAPDGVVVSGVVPGVVVDGDVPVAPLVVPGPAFGSVALPVDSVGRALGRELLRLLSLRHAPVSAADVNIAPRNSERIMSFLLPDSRARVVRGAPSAAVVAIAGSVAVRAGVPCLWLAHPRTLRVFTRSPRERSRAGAHRA